MHHTSPRRLQHQDSPPPPSRVGLARAYRIALAGLRDLPLIPEIELASAELLVGHAPESVLRETTSPFALRKAQRAGRLWLALEADTPVGFAHVVVHESGEAHLEELGVHPSHGRCGLGRRLVQTVAAWATSHGFDAVTLTTFRDVPWNMPFFARLGFEAVAPEMVGASLRAVVDDETRRGLEPARRIVMRYHA
jgi:GNAT superfamily N-acetyltransferase